ncbi:aminotransferase class I/II-fold pyridoxal phosphate-dependent enzyme [Patescibacteria group bacterium]|nr:aminotransferase class I/II-fold pyridoxal phosphate-dependent enzyme [Patescibacteria group bacterium]
MSIFKRFQPIAAAFAPNYTFWDCLIAGKYLLPWNWDKLQKGKNYRRLERKFCGYMGSRWAVSFDSGRSGFYAILKCLQIKDYDEIILQAFTTVALPNIIQWCGAKPVFVDIKEKTLNIDPSKIEKKITKKTKAIIVQHTFGNPAEIDEIIKIAKKHNLYIIEDCAHSLGAEYQGKKTGTFGDAAFFSLGRDKVISSVAGGVVVTNNNELGEKIKQFRDQMPYPKKSLVFRQLLHPIITFKALRVYYFFNIGKMMMFVVNKFKILPKAYTKEEKSNQKSENFPAKMPNSLARIALHQMKLINKFNNHRIVIANYYKRDLKNNLKINLPGSTLETKNIFLWYTIFVENKKEILKKAQKNHIILGDWFPQVVGPAEINLVKSGYKTGDCPIAEKVSSRCVNLPTHHKIDNKDVEKITSLFNE